MKKGFAPIIFIIMGMIFLLIAYVMKLELANAMQNKDIITKAALEASESAAQVIDFDKFESSGEIYLREDEAEVEANRVATEFLKNAFTDASGTQTYEDSDFDISIRFTESDENADSRTVPVVEVTIDMKYAPVTNIFPFDFHVKAKRAAESFVITNW